MPELSDDLCHAIEKVEWNRLELLAMQNVMDATKWVRAINQWEAQR